MKKRVTAVVALAALLMCTFASAAPAPEAMETEVAVTFVESIYFVDLPTGGMRIGFGSRKLPPTNEDTFIVAADGSHTLRVRDGRKVAGDWKVDAVMSAMTSGTDSFDCALHLYNPGLSDGLTASLTGEDPDQYTLIDQDTQPIMTADPDLIQDEYDLTVSAENTRLFITKEQSALLKILNYKATITWTLSLTPP